MCECVANDNDTATMSSIRIVLVWGRERESVPENWHQTLTCERTKLLRGKDLCFHFVSFYVNFIQNNVIKLASKWFLCTWTTQTRQTDRCDMSLQCMAFRFCDFEWTKMNNTLKTWHFHPMCSWTFNFFRGFKLATCCECRRTSGSSNDSTN